MQVTEFSKGAKFALSVTLTPDSVGALAQEFPQVKAALLDWQNQRRDKCELVMFTVMAPPDHHSAIESLLAQVYHAEAELGPLLHSIEVQVALLNTRGKPVKEYDLRHCAPPTLAPQAFSPKVANTPPRPGGASPQRPAATPPAQQTPNWASAAPRGNFEPAENIVLTGSLNQRLMLAQKEGTSGMAIASLALAIPSFFLSILTAIPAIIVGIVALNKINASRGRLGGQGLAIAGIAVGVVAIPVSYFLLRPAIQASRMGAHRATSAIKMKNLSTAVELFRDNHPQWPDRIEDLKPYVEGERGFKAIMRNPVTGDEQGYVYVRPNGDLSAARSQIVILQLRDGKPDPGIAAGFFDHRQRIPTAAEFADAQQRRAAMGGVPPTTNPEPSAAAPPNPVVTARLVPPRPTAPPTPPPPIAVKTQLVGGFTGREFQRGGDPGTRFVGVRCEMHPNWEGRAVIQSLVPYYTKSGDLNNELFATARDGYVVGGLVIDADTYLNAVQVIFVRDDRRGKVDRRDRYKSQWLGKPTGGPTKEYPEHGEPVAGLYGLNDQVITALGLIVELPAGSPIPELPPRVPPLTPDNSPKRQSEKPPEESPFAKVPQTPPVVNDPPAPQAPAKLPIDSVETALAAAQEPDRGRNLEAAKWLNEVPRKEVSVEQAKKVAQTLSPLVKSEDHRVRESFASAFSRFAAKSDIGRLEEMAAFDPKYANCWGPAMAALVRLNPTKASKILELRLDDFSFRVAVVGELKKLDTSYEAALIPLLNSEKHSLRVQAVDLLGDTGTKKSIPAIQKAAATGDRKDQFFMKRHAETAIGKIRQREEANRK